MKRVLYSFKNVNVKNDKKIKQRVSAVVISSAGRCPPSRSESCFWVSAFAGVKD